jgi:hypothetical protein
MHSLRFLRRQSLPDGSIRNKPINTITWWSTYGWIASIKANLADRGRKRSSQGIRVINTPSRYVAQLPPAVIDRVNEIY